MQADKEREARLNRLKGELQERLIGIKERIGAMEENVKRETSSEEVMISTVLKRSYMEETQKRYEKVAQTHELLMRDLEMLKDLVGLNEGKIESSSTMASDEDF